MEKITFNKQYIISKSGSERGEQLEKFLSRLNPPRIQSGYRPLTIAGLNSKLSHIPTEDLYAFYKQCDQARNFSKFFWYSLKPKNETI